MSLAQPTPACTGKDDWPLLLRVQEAAFHLRLTTRGVYLLIGRGQLDLVKIGWKTSRVTSASVLALAGRRGTPGRSPAEGLSRGREPRRASRTKAPQEQAP